MNKILSVFFTILLGIQSLSCYSETEIEALSPQLRLLLKQEMQAVQSGMQKIIPAFAAGDFEQLASIAGNISQSYILKQKLTQSQKHELHEKLSKEFMQKDIKFHQYAGMLEHVSKKRNEELIGFYYSKLLESCVACHSVHARHRFPQFIEKSVEQEHHH